jgi:hypothetical protein
MQFDLSFPVIGTRHGQPGKGAHINKCSKNKIREQTENRTMKV